MRGLPQILLIELQFTQQARLWHSAEERMERLARLEIERPIFGLHQHIVRKLPIKGLEIQISTLDLSGSEALLGKS